MKRVLAVLLSAVLSLSVAVVPGIQTLAEEPDAAQKTEGQQEAEVEVQAPSAVLMEASTGAVLYEKDADLQIEIFLPETDSRASFHEFHLYTRQTNS